MGRCHLQIPKDTVCEPYVGPLPPQMSLCKRALLWMPAVFGEEEKKDSVCKLQLVSILILTVPLDKAYYSHLGDKEIES